MASPPWRISGSAVRAARVAKAWTVLELAEKAGIAERRLRTIETQSPAVSAEMLRLLAQTLGMNHGELLASSPAETPSAAVAVATVEPPRGGPPAESELEAIVAREQRMGPRPTVRWGDEGETMQVLGAKQVQDVLTAYALHAGARWFVRGRVDRQRGIPSVSERVALGASPGTAGRFLVMVPVAERDEIYVTVHTREGARTKRMQAAVGGEIGMVIEVVVAGEGEAPFSAFGRQEGRAWAFVAVGVEGEGGVGGTVW